MHASQRSPADAQKAFLNEQHKLLRKLRQHAHPAVEGAAPVRAEIPAPSIEGNVATIRLYDVIDSFGEFWGVSAREFATVLDELPSNVAEIQLLINCPGGDAFEGVAIMNLLRRHDARVVAVVEGIAASAASFIACAADELVMSRNSELMIHDAWGICIGNAGDMEKTAEILNHVSDNIADVYAQKSGGTVEFWRDVMRDEAWYSAAEAVEAGLADRVDEKVEPDDAQPADRFDLDSLFAYAGRAEAPAPPMPTDPPAESEPAGVNADAFKRRHRLNARKRGLPVTNSREETLAG